ncbi:MAG: DUF3662 domain-containing protein [Coriobacteriia bacterium]|nr:DUF3662 domain-containing protein [Coriobacteriia bacterium]
MSILSDFEDRAGRIVEGGFARMFRSPVQPAELAHKLGREMDRSKVVGIGRVYAPTMYSVLLSQPDDARLGGFAATLAGELETYLVGYARERSYTLAARPIVRFLVDDQLKLGRVEVIGELLSPEELAQERGVPAGAEAHSDPVIVSATPGPAPAAVAEHPARVTVGEAGDVALLGDRMIVGRTATCDITLADKNVSREHAAFVREGDGWAIEDLGSTNGTTLNGRSVESARLHDADVVAIGVTTLVYHEPTGSALGRPLGDWPTA